MSEEDRARYGLFAKHVAVEAAGQRAFAAALVDAAQETGVDGAIAFAVGNVLLDFERQHGLTLQQDAAVIERLVGALEKARNELLVCETTEINLPFLAANATGPKHLALRIGRAEMLELTSRTPEPDAVPAVPTVQAVHPEVAVKRKRFWIF